MALPYESYQQQPEGKQQTYLARNYYFVGQAKIKREKYILILIEIVLSPLFLRYLSFVVNLFLEAFILSMIEVSEKLLRESAATCGRGSPLSISKPSSI